MLTEPHRQSCEFPGSKCHDTVIGRIQHTALCGFFYLIQQYKNKNYIDTN